MGTLRAWVLGGVLAPVVLCGQNLVPNGSFEDYTTCPQGFGNWIVVEGWESPYLMSADYYNVCATNQVGVPLNILGYQYPATGDGYMGIGVYLEGDPTNQEQIAVQLTEPLEPGIPVCLSFKVAIGGFGTWNAVSPRFTCKGVGMKFFATWPMDYLWWNNLFQPAPNDAVIYLDEVPMDTAIWYTVSGTYVPDSAYTHMAIGNFFDEIASDITILDSTGVGQGTRAYAFVDDVIVSFDTNACGTLGVSNATKELKLLGYPNPTSGRLTVGLAGSNTTIDRVVVHDILGQPVQVPLQRSDAAWVIDLSSTPDGLYIIACVISDGTQAVVKAHHLNQHDVSK